MRTKAFLLIGLFVIAGCSGSNKGGNEDAAIQDSTFQDVMDAGVDTAGDMEGVRDVSADDLIAKGKAALGKRVFKQAQEFFQQALDKDPGDRQAQFGLFLADFQKWVGLVNAVLSAYAPTDDIFGQQGAALESKGGKDLSAMLLQYFTDFRAHETTAIGWLESCLKDPNFRFSIDHYPIYVEGKTRIDLGGTFDRADVLWLLSMEYGLRAIMNFLLSNDWGKDGVRFYNAVHKGLGFKSFGSSFYPMLRDEPGFLARSKVNPDAFQAFLNDLDSWAQYGLQAAEAIKAQGRPKDAIFVLLPQGKDKTLVAIRGRYAGTKGALKFLLTGPNYGLIDSYNKVRAAVAGNALLPFKEGFGVPLSVALDVVRQVVPLAGIVSVFNLPAEYASMIQLIQSKPADGTSFTDLLFSVLPMFLFDPSAVALDLKAAADKDFALRDLFAAIPTKAGVLPYDGEFMEYDCPRIALSDRHFVFDQPLKVVLWDLSAQDKVQVTAKVYHGSEEQDSETFTLNPVPDIKGLFTGNLPTRLSDTPSPGDSTLEGDETQDVVEVTYNVNNTPLTLSITNGKPDSYAGEVLPCVAKPQKAFNHFDGTFYTQFIDKGLPYPAQKASDKAYRLWPGALKKVIYVNPKVLKVDKTDKFVPADSYLFDVLAKGLI